MPQLASIGWSGRQGLAAPPTSPLLPAVSRNNRILWGGCTTIYHFAAGCAKSTRTAGHLPAASRATSSRRPASWRADPGSHDGRARDRHLQPLLRVSSAQRRAATSPTPPGYRDSGSAIRPLRAQVMLRPPRRPPTRRHRARHGEEPTCIPPPAGAAPSASTCRRWSARPADSTTAGTRDLFLRDAHARRPRLRLLTRYPPPPATMTLTQRTLYRLPRHRPARSGWAHHQTLRRYDGTSGPTSSVTAGQFLSLLGPSGCGRTTLLRMIAGSTFGRGDIAAASACSTWSLRGLRHGVPVGTLFPHMTVTETSPYGLRRSASGAAEVGEPACAHARHGADTQLRQPGAAEALGRPAAACRLARAAGPTTTGRYYSRRPDVGARPPAARRDADRAEAPAAPARHHLRLRHARPAGGLSMSARIVVMRPADLQQVHVDEAALRGTRERFVAGFIGERGTSSSATVQADGALLAGADGASTRSLGVRPMRPGAPARPVLGCAAHRPRGPCRRARDGFVRVTAARQLRRTLAGHLVPGRRPSVRRRHRERLEELLLAPQPDQARRLRHRRPRLVRLGATAPTCHGSLPATSHASRRERRGRRLCDPAPAVRDVVALSSPRPAEHASRAAHCSPASPSPRRTRARGPAAGRRGSAPRADRRAHSRTG